MSGEAILENPALFSGKNYDLDDLALEYLQICNEFKPIGGMIKAHLFKFYYE